MKLEQGLTYDDVLLVPQRSYIDHRSDVSTETMLTKGISLHIPFISANMDTVTESQMAIAMAKEGGVGIIHRFMTIEEQVEEVIRVKRNVGFILDAPYVVSPETQLRKVIDLSKKYSVDSFVVVDSNKKVVGILTKRDYLFEEQLDKKVYLCMTKRKDLIIGKEGITLNQVKKIFMKYKVEKLPLIDDNNLLKGLITAKSIVNYEKYPHSTKDERGRYRVGAAVGVVNDFIQRSDALLKAGVDALVVDVAHGHNDVALRAVSTLRKKYRDAKIIGGNVATPEGTLDLIKRGVDAVKVGIGPGGLCTTRMVAGVGVPQFTAVTECVAVGKKFNIPIIADGGTNYPGDMTKAMAAGASTLMLAGWFAGSDESPGGVIMRKGMKYKVHRGSASFLATADRKIKLEHSSENTLNSIVPEGVEALVPYKGKVADVIYQLVGALRSGMSYCNAKTITELWKKARFVQITDAGFRESKSHNVSEI
ncbi:IMP dehydrogenase [Candidatus Roizmanbacteria bacterium CG_4_10_14_0_8_um_filter_33_9]|uniref:IMP dehydrogenase n=1 Tax=Candidatus Roizmanbacteria bacterium CG_4_10_14_0_8_um_filter_33_9 TaxID=1974826 RepID=A0A2M7QH16_9BACT|nr:MAG: IMP dehydrogenase [Candidatus Roizmanbacteria bacterium CG_4_10_14_0_8_um_filter_33_9]